MVRLVKVTPDDAELIGNLALQVWYKTYGKTHSQEQLDYMYEMMYAPDKIKADCEGDNAYFILYDHDKPEGYMSVTVEGDKLILQKVYILHTAQGKGYGRFMLNEAERYAREKCITKLQLIVNRYNKALQFYEHMGFKIIGQRDFDIGNGFFMNDYIMEKICN